MFFILLLKTELPCSEGYELLSGTTYSVEDAAFWASTIFGPNYCAACSRMDDAYGWASRSGSETGDWVAVDLGI